MATPSGPDVVRSKDRPGPSSPGVRMSSTHRENRCSLVIGTRGLVRSQKMQACWGMATKVARARNALSLCRSARQFPVGIGLTPPWPDAGGHTAAPAAARESAMPVLPIGDVTRRASPVPTCARRPCTSSSPGSVRPRPPTGRLGAARSAPYRERSVKDLTETKGMKISNTSAQLRTLADAGMVASPPRRSPDLLLARRPAGHRIHRPPMPHRAAD